MASFKNFLINPSFKIWVAPVLAFLAFLAGWGVPAIVMNIKEPEQLTGEVSTGTGLLDLIYYKYDPPFDGQDSTVAESHHTILMQRPDFYKETRRLVNEDPAQVNLPRLKAFQAREEIFKLSSEAKIEATRKNVIASGQGKAFTVTVPNQGEEVDPFEKTPLRWKHLYSIMTMFGYTRESYGVGKDELLEVVEKAKIAWEKESGDNAVIDSKREMSRLRHQMSIQLAGMLAPLDKGDFRVESDYMRLMLDIAEKDIQDGI